MCAELSYEDSLWSLKNLLNQVETDNSVMILDYITSRSHLGTKKIVHVGYSFVKSKAT